MRSRTAHFPIAVVAAAILITAAPAQAADLTVRNAWFRALPPSVPSGGYFTLHNGGGKPVTLTGASSPACGMLMLHRSDNKGGMSSMDDVAEVAVPAGGNIAFAPGGFHLMCMGATAALKPGHQVPVTLAFRDGARVTAQFAVRNAAGK